MTRAARATIEALDDALHRACDDKAPVRRKGANDLMIAAGGIRALARWGGTPRWGATELDAAASAALVVADLVRGVSPRDWPHRSESDAFQGAVRRARAAITDLLGEAG